MAMATENNLKQCKSVIFKIYVSIFLNNNKNIIHRGDMYPRRRENKFNQLAFNLSILFFGYAFSYLFPPYVYYVMNCL